MAVERIRRQHRCYAGTYRRPFLQAGGALNLLQRNWNCILVLLQMLTHSSRCRTAMGGSQVGLWATMQRRWALDGY